MFVSPESEIRARLQSASPTASCEYGPEDMSFTSVIVFVLKYFDKIYL